MVKNSGNSPAPVLCAFLCLTTPALRALEPAEVVEVEAIGQGLSDDEARRDALRRALEQGAGAWISSHSKVQNYELLHDTIYAKADGIVSDYTILEQSDAAGGVKYCKIRAKVSKSLVVAEWGAIQNLLEQVGRPAIAVFIQERIDGVVQDSSILQAKIEERLTKAGFDVRAGEHLREMAEKERLDARREDDVAKVQAIVKDFHTQVYIVGTANADAAGIEQLAGQRTAMYNADGVIKMYYTDSAQYITAESLANWRGGARGFQELSAQAGRKALENAGEELVERCIQSVLKNWTERITAGGELTLEISKINYANAIKVKEKLSAIGADKLKIENPSLTKGIATFRIKAQMNAETLAGNYLVAEDWQKMIAIEDVKPNRIQAQWIANESP